MKTITFKNYLYQNALAEFNFEEVTLFVPDDAKDKISSRAQLEKIDYALSAEEIMRLERHLGLRFFEENYRDIFEGLRMISIEELRTIQGILFVNRTDFAKLLGLHKASVTNLYKGKNMSSTMANLIMERLGNELSHPGTSKSMLDGAALEPTPDEAAASRIHEARFRRLRTATA